MLRPLESSVPGASRCPAPVRAPHGGPGPPCQAPFGAALAGGLPGLNATPSHHAGTVRRALPGRRPQGLGPPAREENSVPGGCPLVMAGFAAGQGQVKFQLRPQKWQVGGSVDFPRPLH